MNNVPVKFAKLFLLIFMFFLAVAVSAQQPNGRDKQRVRTVTIPISIFTKKEIKENQTDEFVQADRLIVKEDRDDQEILSIRSVANTPLEIAVLIQDDLTGNINLQLKDISNFIRSLPSGTRVLVGYIRGGNLSVLQRFTDDMEKAAKAIRIVTGSGAASGTGPYDGVTDAVRRFDALPNGRRAILLVSDGLDATQGTSPSDISRSLGLERAISKAQKRSVAVYAFYTPTLLTENGNSSLVLGGQGALQRISDETGGRAFFQGTSAPISFDPYFKDLSNALRRQFALTYLSTHLNKGYHKVEVLSTNPEIRIEHPKGYFYR